MPEFQKQLLATPDLPLHSSFREDPKPVAAEEEDSSAASLLLPLFLFSVSTGYYLYKESRERVEPFVVNDWIDTLAERMKANLGFIAEQHRAGKINLAEWVIQTGEEIRNAHRAVAIIAAGGKDNMTPSDWGFVGAQIRRELQYLNGFANAIENRPENSTLTTAFVSRAKSYGAAIYETYEKAKARRITRQGQADTEANFLEPGAEHCADCLEATAQGRVPLGTLTPIGDRECGSKCRCRIIYYQTLADGTVEERGVISRHGCYE